MEWKNALKAIFGTNKPIAVKSTWQEIGAHQSYFGTFGSDVYASEIVRSCIRSIAEHTSKANVKVVRRVNGQTVEGDKRLEKLIQYRPNMYMNGKDFLYKVRTRLEIDNTAFIYIQRDDYGRCIGLYPMPQNRPTAIESTNGRLYIKFDFYNTGKSTTVNWEDLAILRKDYNESDIYGDNNSAILTSLELLNTVNTGLGNAIESTANLRGILKSTKAMIDPEDVKKQKDQFVLDYLNTSNEGGIASLDATQDFTPIKMEPQVANYKHVEELRLNIYRYFGVNDDVLMAKTHGPSWQAFYESTIEGFLIALSLELTNKVFSAREQGFGNEIIFESNRLQYADIEHKLAMVALVDRGAMTPNQWREIFNMAPIEGGDVPIRRLDTAPTSQVAESQGEDKNSNTNDNVV